MIYKGFISLYFYIFLCAPPKSTSISANFFPTDFFIQPMSASRSLQNLIICWCGGIGRRPRLKISFKQLSTGSIPVTSTIAKPRKPLFYAVFGAFTFNKSCIADIAKNRRYLLFLIFWRCSQMLRTVDITCSFVLRKVCRRCPAIPYFA